MTGDSEQPPLLAIRDLRVSFDTDAGAVRAVDTVSLDLQPGETLGLVGESGCGKSVTALSVLSLLPQPPARIESGNVRFDGRDLLALSPADRRPYRGARIGMIFQEPGAALSPLHRAGSQLAETYRYHHPRTPAAECRARVLDWLGRVGIADPVRVFDAWPHELSGGMAQRVMIAGAMLLEPDVMIADEPSTALDVTVQAQVLDLLRGVRDALRGGRRGAVLLITHDMGVVWSVCDRVAVMYAGEIVEAAPAAAIFEAPAHPYTQALLRSVPRLDGTPGRLPTIPGQVPTLRDPLPGCRFRDRCPYAFGRCAAEHPAFFPTPAGSARCFLHAADGKAEQGSRVQGSGGIG